MISSTMATIIMIALLLFLLVAIPFLDMHPTLGKYISKRYTLVCVFLVLSVGVVLDFSHLSETTRNTVLIGSITLVGLYMILRGLEKLKLGDRNIKLSAEKGDAKASLEIDK